MPRLPRSARTRVLLTFLVLLAASTAVSTLLLRGILQARVGERVDSSLVQEVEEFRTLARQGVDPRTSRRFTDAASVFDVYLARNVPSVGETWLTFVDGRPYRATRQAVPATLRERAQAFARRGSTVREEVDGRRVLAVPFVLDGRTAGTFVVAIDLDGEEDEIDQAVQVAAGVSLVVLVVAGLIAFALAGRVLRPLRDVTHTARAITESDLSRRIDVRGDDEVAELGRTFNAMLDRLEDAFASQRDFVSDAGHELRTPITIVRGHLDTLGDDPQEREDVLAIVSDELDRMSRIVDDLLTLAKAEQPDFLRLEDVDLDLLTDELHAKAQQLGPQRWVLAGVGTGRITADRQRLTQAVVNLAANAAQHAPADSEIALSSAIDGERATLRVVDRGPGIAPADAERVFDRFARGRTGARRSDGAGLGLSIVRAIAHAHGGDVAHTPTPGGGATFTITVPTEPEGG